MTSTDHNATPTVEPASFAVPPGWGHELRQTLALAWPLAVAQLAQNALLTTDVIMMGWLGPSALAAGSLATAFLNTFLIGAISMVGAVAALVAQDRGRRDIRGVRRTFRQGLWVAIALAAILVPLLWQIRPILLALGQDPAAVLLAESYVHQAVPLLFPALMLIVLRSFLAAFQDTRIVLVITVVGIFVNAGANWVLMFGNLGFPRLELQGAALATLIVNTFMMLLMAAYVLTHRRYRRYHLLGRFWRPDWPRFFSLLRVGAPIGLMVLAEVGLFTAAALLMGLLGTDELAAHAVALQCSSLAFMLPLGLSQATTVRVGLAYGRKDRVAVGRAGWTSLGLTLAFMCLTATSFLVFPTVIVGLFLDPANAGNAQALALAAAYLGIAGLFQLADGAQVSAAGALRGLTDTTMPMVIALIGYWAVGLPVAYVLGFVFDLRGVGVWIGLAAGLGLVAVVLNVRFALRDRLGLVPGA